MTSQQESILQAVEKFVFKVFENRSSFPEILRLFESTKRALTDFEQNNVKTLRSKSALTLGTEQPHSAKKENPIELKLSPQNKHIPVQDRISKVTLKEYFDRKKITIPQENYMFERYSHIRELVPDSQNLYRVLGLGLVESLLQRNSREKMQLILENITTGKIDLNSANDNKSKNMRTIFCSYLSQLSKAATKETEIPKAREELYEMCNKHQVFDALMVSFSKGILVQELSKNLSANADLIFKVQRGIGVKIEELLPFLPDAFEMNFVIQNLENSKISESLYPSRRPQDSPSIYLVCEQYVLHQNFHILFLDNLLLPRLTEISFPRLSFNMETERASYKDVSDFHHRKADRSPSIKNKTSENFNPLDGTGLKFYPLGDTESAKKRALTVRTTNQENSSYKKTKIVDIDLEKDQPIQMKSERKVLMNPFPSPTRNYPVTREESNVTRINLATPTQRSGSKNQFSHSKSNSKVVLDLSAEYSVNNTSKISSSSQNFYPREQQIRENRESLREERSLKQIPSSDYMFRPSDPGTKKKVIPKMMTMKPINMETLPSNPFSAFTPSIYSAKEYSANLQLTRDVFPPYPNFDQEMYPRVGSVEPSDKVYSTIHYGGASMSNGFKRYSQNQGVSKHTIPTMMQFEGKSIRRIQTTLTAFEVQIVLSIIDLLPFIPLLLL